MILRFLSIITVLLLTMFSVEAALSDKEKLATAAALAVANAKNNKPHENKAPKLASIDVTGVDDELKKNIELHMPVNIPICTAERGDVRLFFTTIKKNFRKASRALGYYDAEFVSGGSIVNGCWKLKLRITPGKPTRIIKQTIKVIGEGRQQPVFKKILQKLPYEKGDILNHEHYSDFKTRLSEAAQSLGYFDAEFEKHIIRVDPLSYQASINLLLNTGKRYRYGEVTVERKVLSEKAIKKYLVIRKGKPFSTEEIIQQQQILQGSGYYDLIKINVLHDQAKNQQIPIEIELTRKKRNAYKFKVGFGTDTGARVSAEMNRRWTGSKGKQFKTKVQYAETLSGVSLQLLNPRENPEDNSLIYNFDVQEDSNDDVVSRSINVGGKLIRKHSNDWIQTASIQILEDRTKVEGDEGTQSTLLLFGIGLDKTKADSLIHPENGWRITLGLSAANESLLSDQNVLQFRGQLKRVNKIGPGRLLSRLKLGSTQVSDFDRLPKSLRFFAGGGNSVRGYDFENLGELNDENKVIGGRHLIELSLEYQHPIAKGWSAAFFVDAGNAFDDFNRSDLKVGVGFGARWKSPVGPVKIDIGFPKDDFKDPHLHLSVGADL